ncbi:MAG: hypothetical protein LBC21_02025, partial [Oscillospiraceae bacterium]|jgi:hypothetical protein|nr:hypothetical protein [Oscillospiraceae bacterium]
VNAEIDFGDGRFGKRFSGTITGSIAAGTKTVNTIGNVSAGIKLRSLGGSVLSGVSNNSLPIPYCDYDGTSVTALASVYVSSSGSVNLLQYLKTEARNGTPYDIWMTYAKS